MNRGAECFLLYGGLLVEGNRLGDDKSAGNEWFEKDLVKCCK